MSPRTDLKLTLIISEHMKRMLQVDRHEKACFGVTLSQHYVIDALNRRKMLTMNTLGKETGQAISTLTRIVDNLVRDNIATRRTSEEDRRKVLVELTDEGLALAEKLRKCTEMFWSHVLKSIPDGKKNQIIESIRLLDDALEKTDMACCLEDMEKEGKQK